MKVKEIYIVNKNNIELAKRYLNDKGYKTVQRFMYLDNINYTYVFDDDYYFFTSNFGHEANMKAVEYYICNKHNNLYYSKMVVGLSKKEYKIINFDRKDKIKRLL